MLYIWDGKMYYVKTSKKRKEVASQLHRNYSIFQAYHIRIDEVRERKGGGNMGFANFAREIVVGTIILIIGAIIVSKLVGLM